MQQQLSRTKPDWSAGLATDVWMDMFARLVGERIEELLPQLDSKARLHTHEQGQYQRLRLVCRKFQNMLQQDQRLSQQLWLSHNF